jgi:hypothetical protein
MKQFLTIMIMLLFTSSAFAEPVAEKSDSKKLIESGGLSKEEFDEVVKSVADVYIPLLKESYGIKLLVEGVWDSDKINAGAGQNDEHWYVKVYGGLARHPKITSDAVILAFCHELGHHLGGYPYTFKLASEGQSDYFATLSCGKMIFANDSETNSLYRNVIPEKPKKLCDESWASENDQDVCYRLMMAGYSLSSVFAAKRNIEVSFDKKDPKIVPYTNYGYPSTQCRLETYMAGALCTAELDPDVIPGKNDNLKAKRKEEESAKHLCSVLNGDTVGIRPRCWFKSKFE